MRAGVGRTGGWRTGCRLPERSAPSAEASSNAVCPEERLQFRALGLRALGGHRPRHGAGGWGWGETAGLEPAEHTGGPLVVGE